MNQQLCDPNRLSSFVRGELSAEAERELTAHLDECASCGRALEQQVADAAAWREAGAFLGDRHFQQEEAESSVNESRESQIQHVVSQLSPTDDPNSLGRIGGYEVTGVIGSGGMGVVLKAHDHSLDRVVAVKVMAPHLAASGSARKRFAREAKAAAAVLHPNVIAIHGVSNEQALPYLIMPYVRGESLQKRIDAEGPLQLPDILRIATQVAAGLAAAHEQGLVHRDIKPGNILMEQGVERVTITDFGLARAVDDASMTRSGVIAGTPQYMSPEQARGEPIDARSDLFSLGSLLYAMCTGHSPFRAETSFGVIHRITQDSPRPIAETNPEIPLWMEGIVMKLLSKRAEDRFQSAGEVAELLEGCLSHTQHPAITPLPEPVVELASKPSQPRSWFKWIAAGVFLWMLLFAGILIILEWNKGTLRIESEADDVPIRIVQGKDVVKELTVSKSGESVRIAAGNYEVEIGGRVDGLLLDNGSVTLRRGGNDVVRIVEGVGKEPAARAAVAESATPQTRLDFEAHPQDVIALQIGATKHNQPLEWTSTVAETGPFSVTITDEKVRLDEGSWGPGLTFKTQDAKGRVSTRYIAMAEDDPLPGGTLRLYKYKPNTLRDLKTSVAVGEIKYPDGTSAPVSVTARASNRTMVYVPVRVASTGDAVDKSANQSSISPRRKTVDNLTRIIHALQRYHEVHGHFPAATIHGKYGKGGPPHSWRVALLPFLGHQLLYDRYNFKASWDTQRNNAVLAQMPDVYRSPLDQGNSTNTSYFGVVSDDISKRAAQLQQMRNQREAASGAGILKDEPEYEQYTPEATVFWKQRGASLIDMLDGTSNCIAVIEAKRDVPWTKPEDIEYSADHPLPKFGGWFEEGVHAAFADGTVRFLANYNDEQTIRNLLTISDGQPVEPLLVRRLRIHGAIAVSEDEPEKAAGPETYQVPGGPLLRIQPDQQSVLTEADVVEAAATTDPYNPSGGDIVAMTLTEEAGKRFLEATTKLSDQGTNGYMVITFDRKVLSAPRVTSPIGNKLTITGNIDAKKLAEQVQAAMQELETGETPPPMIVGQAVSPVEEAPSHNDTNRRTDARSVVESYIAAALAKDVERAAALAKGSPADLKTIAEIPDFLNVQRLKILTVYVNDAANPTRAMATSEAVRLDAEHKQPNGDRDGFLVLTLELIEDVWLVTDIDFETQSGADEELKRFLEASPNSIGIPPSMPKKSELPADVYSNASSVDQSKENAGDQRSIASEVRHFNESTAKIRSELFDPPIPDLTVERLRQGLTQSAEIYRGQGKQQVADALRKFAGSGRLPKDALGHLFATGTHGKNERGETISRQVVPALYLPDDTVSTDSLLVVLRPLELFYRKGGPVSRDYGDLFDQETGRLIDASNLSADFQNILGHWGVVSVEGSGGRFMSLSDQSKPSDRLVIPHVETPSGRLWLSAEVQETWAQDDSLHLHPEADPARLTYKANGGKSNHFADTKNPPEYAIYQLEGNELTILAGDPRDFTVKQGRQSTPAKTRGNAGSSPNDRSASWTWKFVIPNYAKEFRVEQESKQILVKLKRMPGGNAGSGDGASDDS